MQSRLDFIRRSVECYCAQTVADRELLIVTDGGADADSAIVDALIAGLGRADVRCVATPHPMTLGEKRNFSVAAARGNLIAQWDDDDLYHPERLARQLSALEEGGHDAVYLEDLMQYRSAAGQLYLTNWRATPAGGHPGTLMARRDAMPLYPERGEAAARGEDLAVALALNERGVAGYLRGQPHLFIYVSHGANTWADDHHDMLIRELSVSKAVLQRREAALRDGLGAYAFPADSIDVVGNNGVAFRL